MHCVPCKMIGFGVPEGGVVRIGEDGTTDRGADVIIVFSKE